MANQIQWDDKPNTSQLAASGIQWDDKPDTSQLKGSTKQEQPQSQPSARGSGQWYKEKVEGALEPTTADVSPDSGVIRSQLIAPAKTLGREVYSAGKTALGLIPGIYHAFADEPTEEERESKAQFEKEQGEALGAETSGAKRVGLGIERMTTAPLIGAAKTYANPATRPTYEQALSVLPEAMGQGAGTVVGGKLIGDTAAKVPGVAKGAVERITPSSTLGKIAVDEAKQYLIKKIPGHDIYTTTKRIGNRLSEANEPLDSTGENKAYAGERTPKPSGLPRIGEPTAAAPSAPEEPAPARTAGPSLDRLQESLNRGLGNEPIKPGVPLREQVTAPEAAPKAPRTPFEAANGKELDQSISKEFPEAKEASVVREKIHNLSNVELRQLAINLGEDLGQSVISRAKQSGAIPRSEIFKRLLGNNSAADISKAIESGQHLPPEPSPTVKELWERTEGEAGPKGTIGEPWGTKPVSQPKAPTVAEIATRYQQAMEEAKDIDREYRQSLEKSTQSEGGRKLGAPKREKGLGEGSDEGRITIKPSVYVISKQTGTWNITKSPESWTEGDLRNVFDDAQDEANSTGKTLTLHMHDRVLSTFEPKPTVTGPATTPALGRSAPEIERSGAKPSPPSAFPEAEKPSSIVSRRTLLDKLRNATDKLTSKERPEFRAKRGYGFRKTKP